MKRKTIAIIIAIIMCAMYIFLHIYTGVFGSPWGKLRARKEINEYLTNIYGDGMSISSIYYYLDLDAGKYSAWCYKKDEVDVKFNVSYYESRLVDDYHEIAWNSDIKKALNNIIQYEKTSITITIDYRSEDFNEIRKKYGIARPNVFLIQDDIWKWIEIKVSFDYKYNSDAGDNETALKVINKLKEYIKFKKLILSYENVYYTFSNDEIEEINTIEEYYDILNGKELN